MSLLKVNEVQNYNGSSLTLTASTVSTSAQLNTGGNISVTGSLNVSDDSTTRSNLGLGSIATQAADSVSITGGSVTGTEIDLKSSGTTIFASDGTTPVLSESGGLVTIAETVQHVVPIVIAKRSTSDQSSISSSTFTKVLFNDEVTDTHNFFDGSTNYRFQPTIAGYYKIDTGIAMSATSGSRWIISLYKNGTEFIRLLDSDSSMNYYAVGNSAVVQLNGSTDYVEIYVLINSSNAISVSKSEGSTFFHAFLVQRT